jgi:DNA invertase Pin-like site-specific DNA recombinase
MRYGYVRVSSKDQNIDRQMAAMKAADVPKKNIFIDKKSGKDFERSGYKKMLRNIRAGDEVFIKSIDRLGRNYDEILEQWRILTREKEVDLIVLDFPLLDTRNPSNGLTGKFVADLVLQILSYVSQVERENIHQRQKEGIAEAKKRGKKFGRPELPVSDNFSEIRDLWETEQISLRKAAELTGVSHGTFKKWVQKEK